MPPDLGFNTEFRRMLSGVLRRLSSSKDSKSNTRLEGKEGTSKCRLNASVGSCTFCSVCCMSLFGLFTSLTRKRLRILHVDAVGSEIS